MNAEQSKRRAAAMMGRKGRRRGRKSHARGVCGATGQGEGGGGIRRLLGVGEGRGLSDLEQKTPFGIFDNLYT